MKTHHIKDLLIKEVFIIETPKDGYYSKDLRAIIAYGIMHNIPEGYVLLGKPDEISEEDAMELVEAPEPYWEDNKNQKVIGNAEWSYAKSLLSLLETEIYWENPYKIPSSDDINWYRNQINGDFSERYTRVFDWNEAELRTFDRRKTLIFVKN